jgi:hypothetical protein
LHNVLTADSKLIHDGKNGKREIKAKPGLVTFSSLAPAAKVQRENPRRLKRGFFGMVAYCFFATQS